LKVLAKLGLAVTEKLALALNLMMNFEACSETHCPEIYIVWI
jgi:hypothetical protein